MLAVAAVLLAVASGGAGAAFAVHYDGHTTVVESAPPASVPAGSSAARGLAAVAAVVQPSIVTISVETATSSGEGSGVIIRSDGTILTNEHVIEAAVGGAGTLTVTLSGGRTAQASIIGQDAPADIAVIRAAGISGLTPAAIGFAAALRAGDTVLAVGSPLGLDGTVTSGIVSALNRTISVSSTGPCGGQAASKIPGMIQADTAINPDADGDRLLPYGRSAGRAGRAGLIDDASPAPALRAHGGPAAGRGGWPRPAGRSRRSPGTGAGRCRARIRCPRTAGTGPGGGS